MGQPRDFHTVANWICRSESVDRVRFSKVTIPNENVGDIVIREGAAHPRRQPGEYQPVDIECVGPAYVDDNTETLFNKTVAVIEGGGGGDGGGDVGEEYKFTWDVIQVARDKKTELVKYRFHRCYCGGRLFGDFDAEGEAARVIGVILRPEWIEGPIKIS